VQGFGNVGFYAAKFLAELGGARIVGVVEYNSAVFNAAGLDVAALKAHQAATGSLAGFARLIEALRSEAAGLPLPEVVELVLQKSGLVAHYKAEREGADRVENLEELVNAAASFVQEEGLAGAPAYQLEAAPPATVASGGDETGAAPFAATTATGDDPTAEFQDPLAAFLAHASLESGENQAGEGSDAVQMMTAHSAKGLEFHNVFITGLEEGLFPHENSLNEDEGLEEERRLMYVAITRARTRLYLSFAQSRMLHGQTRYNVASRFFDELPRNLMKWLTPTLARSQRDADPWSGSASAPAPRQASQSAQGMPFRVGQNVSHAKFGAGIIVGFIGGLLVGRKNPKVAVSAQDLVDAVNKAAGK
jgi:DNA helicase-2/ATP-dependent DNA helicase PcrA